MKAIKNIFGILTAVALVACMQACSEDDVDYTPAEEESTDQVYFSSEVSSSIDLSEDETSFDVTVMRIVTTDAITVPLTVSGEDDYFTIPSSVSFSSGSSETTLTIGYDPDAMETDVYYEVTITIDDAYATSYGFSSYTFSAGVSSPWAELGYCYFTEEFWAEEHYHPILYKIEDGNVYHCLIEGDDICAYGYEAGACEGGLWGVGVDFEFYWYPDEYYDEDLGYTYVEVPAQPFGYTSSSYGDLYVYDWYNFFIGPGGYTGYWGDIMTFTYYNGASYPPSYYNGAGAFYFNLYYYYPDYGGGYSGYTYDVVGLLDGYTIADYSLEVAYSGQYTDSDDEPAGVIANVTSMGDDVEYVRVTVVEGKSVSDDDITALTEGTVNYAEVATTGTCMVEWNDTPETGNYTILAVSYADGNAQESATATFKYTAASSETWTAIGTGTYYYTSFFSGTDPGLTLYQSDSDETRYKIEHWGYDVDFCFTYSEDTGDVWVDDQEIGYTHSTYGTVYVDDFSDYAGYETNYGYYDDENSTFYFYVIYYVSAGYFGYGYEYFVIDTDDSSSSGLFNPSGSSEKQLKGVNLQRGRNSLPTRSVNLSPVK